MPKTIKEFSPIGPRVLVEKIDMGERKVGRIVVAPTASGTAKWEPVIARVVHPGTGRLNNDGSRSDPLYREGATVVLAKFRDLNLTVDDREVFVVPEEDILGTVELVESEA